MLARPGSSNQADSEEQAGESRQDDVSSPVREVEYAAFERHRSSSLHHPEHQSPQSRHRQETDSRSKKAHRGTISHEVEYCADNRKTGGNRHYSSGEIVPEAVHDVDRRV